VITRHRQRGQVLPLLAVLLPAVVLGLGLLVDTALPVPHQGRSDTINRGIGKSDFSAHNRVMTGLRNILRQTRVVRAFRRRSAGSQFRLQIALRAPQPPGLQARGYGRIAGVSGAAKSALDERQRMQSQLSN